MAVRGKIRFVLAKVLRMLVVVRLIERRDRSIQRGVLSHQFVRPTLEASVLVDLALGHAVACYAYLSGDTTDSENASCYSASSQVSATRSLPNRRCASCATHRKPAVL